MRGSGTPPQQFMERMMGKRETYDEWFRRNQELRRSMRERMTIIDEIEIEQERRKPMQGESLLDNAERKAIEGQRK